jgi:hypothetical protein
VDGQDVIADASGGYKTLAQVLGLVPVPGGDDVPTGGVEQPPTITAVHAVTGLISFFALMLVRLLFLLLWKAKFTGQYLFELGSGSWTLIALEVVVMIAISVGAAAGSTTLISLL